MDDDDDHDEHDYHDDHDDDNYDDSIARWNGMYLNTMMMMWMMGMIRYMMIFTVMMAPSNIVASAGHDNDDDLDEDD